MITCAWNDCEAAPVGRSKYCRTHRGEARAAWKANREAERAEREARYATFAEVVEVAEKAAAEAYREVKEKRDAGGAGYAVVNTDGTITGTIPDAFGWAWVNVSPGSCSFARWAKKELGASRSYYGGVDIRPRGIDRCSSPDITAKEAACRAYASVLREKQGELGIRAVHAGSRLD